MNSSKLEKLQNYLKRIAQNEDEARELAQSLNQSDWDQLYPKRSTSIMPSPTSPVKELERNYSVYTLSDPRNLTIRYVGISCNPKVRHLQHYHKDPYNHEKYAWIQEVRQAGYRPVMNIVKEKLTKEEATDLEMSMVYELLNQGVSLLNIDRHHPLSHWTQCKVDAPIVAYKVFPLGSGGYWIVGIVDEERLLYRLLEDHKVYECDYHAYPKCKKLNQQLKAQMSSS